MKLDEAIKHAEEVMAENLEKTKGRNASDPIAINCFEYAKEHRQLAAWLKELKQLREQTDRDLISRQDVEDAIAETIVNGESLGYGVANDILSGLPTITSLEQTGGDLISKSVFDQIRWERDVAIDQLKDLGYELGEKPRTDGDLISRTELLNKIWRKEYGKDYDGVNMLDIPHIDIIENMPSAEKTTINSKKTTITDGDLISRQAAIDEIEYELEMINSALDSMTLDFNARERLRQRRGEAREILNSIQQLPPAIPQPKIGRWIPAGLWTEGWGTGEEYGSYYKCSLCGKIVKVKGYSCEHKHCPNCLAKMKEEK